MSLQFSTTFRNSFLDLLDTIPGSYQTLVIYGGSVPANCAASETGTPLVVFDLQQPSWNPAFAGAKDLADITITVLAIADGTANHFRLYDGAVGTCHIQGTVTTVGGGGDALIDNTSIIQGQTMNLTQFTLTAPGA